MSVVAASKGNVEVSPQRLGCFLSLFSPLCVPFAPTTSTLSKQTPKLCPHLSSPEAAVRLVSHTATS